MLTKKIRSSKSSSFSACPAARTKKVIEQESHPWSNSCPRGELDLFLLACFPSIASRVKKTHTHPAATKNYHCGISFFIEQSYLSMLIKGYILNRNPKKLIKLGAIHIGSSLTAPSQYPFSRLSRQVPPPEWYLQFLSSISPSGVMNSGMLDILIINSLDLQFPLEQYIKKNQGYMSSCISRLSYNCEHLRILSFHHIRQSLILFCLLLFDGEALNTDIIGDLTDDSVQEVQYPQGIYDKDTPEDRRLKRVQLEDFAKYHQDCSNDKGQRLRVQILQLHLNPSISTLVTDAIMAFDMTKLVIRPKFSKTSPLYLSQKENFTQTIQKMTIKAIVKHSLIALSLFELLRIVLTLSKKDRRKTIVPKAIAINPPNFSLNASLMMGLLKDDTNFSERKSVRWTSQSDCPNIPVSRCTNVTKICASVTPIWPTFVLRMPVLYSVQVAVQKATWLATKIMKISRPYNFNACPTARTKKAVENESHPWSNSCPRGELVLVLLACFPSIASRVEQAHTHPAASRKHH